MSAVIEALLTASGRVNPGALMRFARSCDVADFCRFVRRPVLAGSGVRSGMMAGRKGPGDGEPNATLAFQMRAEPDGHSLSEVLKHAVYPLVKAPDATRAEHLFAIGRVSGNDCVIPDLAISKRHALIEVRDQACMIRDCGSTNGTRLNGQILGQQFKPLHDGALVTFARYEFNFLVPRSLYQRLMED